MDISKTNCVNLFDYNENFEVPEIPSEFWYLQVLEIVINLEGEHYLVLEYPFYSYSDVVNNEIKECIWAPPYSASKLDVGARRIRKVGQIFEEYANFIKQRETFLKELLDYKLYTMGIGSSGLKENGSILEYKKSFREPNKWKCYYIKRFSLINLDKFDLYNIIDPECIKGYTYLNIEKHSELILHDTVNSAYYFKGKPLASNTTRLFHGGAINALLHNSNQISKDFLTYREKGLLFSFDLISFGKNQGVITDTFKTLDRLGSNIADDFEFLLNNIFGVGLNANCYNQYRLMGDGFIAASPLRHNPLHKTKSEDIVIGDQISKTLNVIEFIFAELKAKAPNYPAQLSCRCSLLFEEYYYGKIGGLVCDKAEIGGRSILRLERLQGVINSWFQEKEVKRPGCIYIAVEESLYNNCKSDFDKFNFDELTKYSGTYKEFEGTIFILTKKI